MAEERERLEAVKLWNIKICLQNDVVYLYFHNLNH